MQKLDSVPTSHRSTSVLLMKIILQLKLSQFEVKDRIYILSAMLRLKLVGGFYSNYNLKELLSST